MNEPSGDQLGKHSHEQDLSRIQNERRRRRLLAHLGRRTKAWVVVVAKGELMVASSFQSETLQIFRDLSSDWKKGYSKKKKKKKKNQQVDPKRR